MKKLKKISFIFFYILIIFMPLQTLLGDILSFHTSLSYNLIFWLTHWYEPVIFLLFVIVFALKYDPKKKFSGSQIITLLLLAFGALSIFITAPTISRGLQGFRFTLLGLIFYLFASEVGLGSKELKTLIKVYLYSALIIAVWAIIERFLPFVYWNVWRIISPATEFGYGWFWGGGFWQSAGIIGAPNQLASYLLPAVFLLVSSIQCPVSDRKKQSNKSISEINERIKNFRFNFQPTDYWSLAAAIVIVIAIFLAFSRSALIGLLFGLCVFVAMQKDKKIKIGTFSGLGIALIFVIWFAVANPHFQQLITHGGQTGHQDSLQTTLTEIGNRFHEPAKLIFGSGLSTAGPLAMKYGDGIISECWYLQLLLELGFVGLILWLAFIYSLLKNLWQKKEEGLFLALVSISVTAIFLHTWADNPALTYTFLMLIGISLHLKKENNV